MKSSSEGHIASESGGEPCPRAVVCLHIQSEHEDAEARLSAAVSKELETVKDLVGALETALPAVHMAKLKSVLGLDVAAALRDSGATSSDSPSGDSNAAPAQKDPADSSAATT